jgi:ribonuclease HI
MIFSDGGARGNPGPAATAFLILSEQGNVLTSNSQYIGTCTNNQAEYYALIYALETAATLKPDEVICHTDSELVAKQLKGEFVVKNPTLKQLWQRVKELEKQFKEVTFVNVPRTHSQIQEADKLVNLTLDKENKPSIALNKNR